MESSSEIFKSLPASGYNLASNWKRCTKSLRQWTGIACNELEIDIPGAETNTRVDGRRELITLTDFAIFLALFRIIT